MKLLKPKKFYRDCALLTGAETVLQELERLRSDFHERLIFSALLLTAVSLSFMPVSPAYCRSYSDDPEMILVKGGCFQMGDVFRNVPSSEKPVHEVCLDDFYAGKYEVTVGEFRKFVDETGYRTEAEWQDGCHAWVGNGKEVKKRDHNWRNTGFGQTDKNPVVCVSWNDAYNYIQWLNKKLDGNYRLPTEAEWEYAARSGGKKYLYSWGNNEPSGNIADESTRMELPEDNIWKGYNDGYTFTAPVGSFKPNELGLYDMSGNVYEWVADWQADGYYANSPTYNPGGPDKGRYKILRGGAWDLTPDTARTTSRYWNVAGARAVCMGFRLAHPAD